MTQAIPYLLQGKNIILVVGGTSHTISKDTHMNYGKIVDALKAKDWAALTELVEPAKAIVNFGKGYVKIENGVVFWKGNPFNNALSNRMIEMYNEQKNTVAEICKIYDISRPSFYNYLNRRKKLIPS